MIKLGKLTDYAIVILSCMVRANEPVQSASHMSAVTDLPEPTVAKVLKILSRGGIVEARRGAGGGYVLKRRAQDITVAEIIEIMEGPIALTSCVDAGDHDCNIEENCPVRGNWNQLNGAVRGALANVSLADMASSREQEVAYG